jgi:hypothetical protein
MSAPRPPDTSAYSPLQVYQASRCVTMRVAGDRGKNTFVEWTHQEFNWLRLTKHLYEHGELSEFFGESA